MISSLADQFLVRKDLPTWPSPSTTTSFFVNLWDDRSRSSCKLSRFFLVMLQSTLAYGYFFSLGRTESANLVFQAASPTPFPQTPRDPPNPPYPYPLPLPLFIPHPLPLTSLVGRWQWLVPKEDFECFIPTILNSEFIFVAIFVHLSLGDNETES